MNNFSQILRRLSTTAYASTSSRHFGGTTPFKVQANFDIPIFKGQIDANALEKWVNLLEGYFSVYNFSDRENITFVLLKTVPHVKDYGILIVSKHPRRNLKCLESNPPRYLMLMLLRGNISPSEIMRTSTQDGPQCDKKGTKQCQSSSISFAPCA